MEIHQPVTLENQSLDNVVEDKLSPQPRDPKKRQGLLVVSITFFLLIVSYLLYQNWQLRTALSESQTPPSDNQRENSNTTQTLDVTLVEDRITFTDVTERGAGTSYAVVFTRPADWIVTADKTKTSDDDLITPCTSYSITDPSSSVQLVYNPICEGYGLDEHLVPLSEQAVIVLEQQRNGNGGPYTLVRYRDTIDSLHYRYGDQSGIGPTKIREAISISFAPPDELKSDGYFRPALVTLAFVSAEAVTEDILHKADQLVGSFNLQEIKSSTF